MPQYSKQAVITGSSSGEAGRRKTLLHLLLLVLLGGMIYANTLQAPFVFDDATYIIGNPVLENWRGFTDADYAEQLMAQGGLNQNFRTRIVTFFTFAVNHQLLGNSLAGYHLVNLAIHLLNSILVYCLVRLTMQTPFARAGGWGGGASGLTALLTALLFVCHPVQTQAVTYISQRFTALATLFYLVSLVAYIAWRLAAVSEAGQPAPSPAPGFLGKRPGYYVISLVAAVLAMRTKEIAFTLPLMLCLYEYCFFRSETWRRWLPLLPFLLTLAIIPLLVWGEKAAYRDIVYLTGSFDNRNPAPPRPTSSPSSGWLSPICACCSCRCGKIWTTTIRWPAAFFSCRYCCRRCCWALWLVLPDISWRDPADLPGGGNPCGCESSPLGFSGSS